MGTTLTYRHEDGINYNYVLPDLIVGSCLQGPEDVDRLQAAGVTTVFSLQVGGGGQWVALVCSYGCSRDLGAAPQLVCYAAIRGYVIWLSCCDWPSIAPVGKVCSLRCTCSALQYMACTGVLVLPTLLHSAWTSGKYTSADDHGI
jgi:hypothetical protein